MDFNPERLGGSQVRCLTTSGEFYEGKLSGFDSNFNTLLTDCEVRLSPSTSVGAGGAPMQTPLDAAKKMWVNGSHVIYIGFLDM